MSTYFGHMDNLKKRKKNPPDPLQLYGSHTTISICTPTRIRTSSTADEVKTCIIHSSRWAFNTLYKSIKPNTNIPLKF